MATLKEALRQVVDVILHSTKIRVEKIRHHEHAMSHLTLLLCVHLHRFLVLNILTALLLLLQILLQILHSNILLLLLPNPLPPPPPSTLLLLPHQCLQPTPSDEPKRPKHRFPHTSVHQMICLKKTITTQQRNPWNPFKFGACEEREFKSQKYH